MTIISSTVISQNHKTFFDFRTMTLEGDSIDLSIYKGKKILVVNTASKCGYTPQYEQLEALYQKYGGDHFTILGFPANNFLSQEPGSNEEIRQFCTTRFGVTFPLMGKVSVKGKDQDPIYRWLTSKEENGSLDAPVKWNFQKFMIDENGRIAGVVPPGTSPLSDQIVNWIERR